MKKVIMFFSLIALLVISSISWAAHQKMVQLSVPGMYCLTCPITVKKSLEKVPGVTDVRVELKTKKAIIIFDPTLTNSKALISATTQAGYPSTVKKNNK